MALTCFHIQVSKVVKNRTDGPKGEEILSQHVKQTCAGSFLCKTTCRHDSAACAKLRSRGEGKAGLTLTDCGFCQRDLGDEIEVAAAKTRRWEECVQHILIKAGRSLTTGEENVRNELTSTSFLR